jgi:hypothetical protein
MKQKVVQRLVEGHFDVEPGLVLICRLEREPELERLPTEPIRLLEVNERTIPLGLQGIGFGADPDAGIHFPSIIFEVTPDEFARIERNELPLPAGLHMTERFERPAVVGGAHE